jgi:hypothetical protein
MRTASPEPIERPVGHRPTVMRRRRLAAVAAGVTAAVTLTQLPASAAEETSPTDPARDAAVIGRWNEVAMGVLTPSGRPLLTQPFVVAAMHVAMYDAVVAIEGQYRPFGTWLTAPPGASSAAAAATAAHDVLVAFLPGSAAVFDVAVIESLAAIPDGPAEADGAAVGRAAANGTLGYRLDDGSQSGPITPPRAPAHGVWAPTPPATSGLTPWIAQARTFTMRSPDQFRPSAPPSMSSPRYRRALDEVRRLGGSNSTERTAEQTTTARFWADQPIAQNQRALRGHAAGLGWEIAPTARLFAAALTSLGDSIIACWDAKYHYQLWRPWQSVPALEPGWAPLLPTPTTPSSRRPTGASPARSPSPSPG